MCGKEIEEKDRLEGLHRKSRTSADGVSENSEKAAEGGMRRGWQ